jgi:ABC-type sugar transport system permease subunit
VVLVVMLQTAAQLQVFGHAQLLTGGGPAGATRTMVLFIFELASRAGNWATPRGGGGPVPADRAA